MATGSSRSRVTRLELTADQLLGSDLTRARPYKPGKSASRVITVEQLLGTSLTIAGPSARSQPSRTPARPTPPRPAPRAPSPRQAAAPIRARVTADEVLRTGVPLRTLQAAKARSRAITLSTESLRASSSANGPRPRSSSRRGVPHVISAEELAGPGLASSSSSGRSAGGSTISVSPSVSPASGLRPGSHGIRGGRPVTAGASSGGSSAVSPTPDASSSTTARGRGPRSGQVQRSNSQGSTRTLPMYTKEPGESEVVIGRGAEELEDEITITVMTPVDEGSPSLAHGLPLAASPSSPVLRETESSDFGRHLRPLDAISPIPIPASTLRTLSVPMPEPDEVPSYEAAMTMTTPDLLATAASIPLPASPAVSPVRSPALNIPGRSGAVNPSTPFSAGSAQGSSNPPSPISEGAESPRRRFQFISLFHSHGASANRSRIRGASVSGLPSMPTTIGRVPSPSPPSPRPFHRSSHSASASMLDLLSRSWSDNPMARSRSERDDA
ncbi:hypothetical protein L226DRAFT_395923 [Lentinus tigrinus ALCF2SS1-7]|uniref:Uncharacterized protein n=1 Tax=Lentinus tigrinus ALCF2SS1-6 TaxID=1328759 RepID=A0A5C2SJS4_9APHY|nr:hypothetical protein L227DRAFT_57858 [Lentinus tigrinus ALCF2SS1-6]RPD76062.1 hypothetical protein L226DRAFT_395923 [Lentinus tigrinus ALCF2SS1-7]